VKNRKYRHSNKSLTVLETYIIEPTLVGNLMAVVGQKTVF